MAGWRVGSLAGWQLGGLAGLQVGRLAGWQLDRLVSWLDARWEVGQVCSFGGRQINNEKQNGCIGNQGNLLHFNYVLPLEKITNLMTSTKFCITVGGKRFIALVLGSCLSNDTD